MTSIDYALSRGKRSKDHLYEASSMIVKRVTIERERRHMVNMEATRSTDGCDSLWTCGQYHRRCTTTNRAVAVSIHYSCTNRPQVFAPRPEITRKCVYNKEYL